MTNVRSVCKTILDFIYINNVLPASIINAIDIYQANEDDSQHIKYDIVAIANILRYKNFLKPSGNATLDKIADIIRETNSFGLGNIDGRVLKWLNDNKDQFDIIIDYCTNFFHNVDVEHSTNILVDAIREIIQSAPDDNFDKGTFLSELYNSVQQQKQQTQKITYSDNDMGRANRKIPKWALNPGAANHEIMKAYFKAEAIVGDGNVTRQMMISLYNCAKPFMSNFAAMKTDAGKAHGKVFEERDGKVFLWDYTKETALKYKNEFLGE